MSNLSNSNTKAAAVAALKAAAVATPAVASAINAAIALDPELSYYASSKFTTQANAHAVVGAGVTYNTQPNLK